MFSVETSRKGRRDTIGIMLVLLQSMQSPIRKTHILYVAGINHWQLQRYLALLEKANAFTVNEDGKYVLNERGRLILQVVEPLSGSLDEKRIAVC